MDTYHYDEDIANLELLIGKLLHDPNRCVTPRVIDTVKLIYEEKNISDDLEDEEDPHNNQIIFSL